tara:strand:+ start:304 stop:810 length:507 start_codon:yes stop_codon:yes gene_type:complete
MADSVVRNANKEDIPIFDSDTDLGDQFFLEQDLDNLTEDPDDIIQRLMDDPNALDPLDQDTTRAPEKFIEPLDAISKKMLEFEGFAEPALGGIDLLDINYVKPKAIPLKYGGSPGIEGLMKKTTIEIQEIPADREMLVMSRIMKKAGKSKTNDPRLMAQLAQVLGRDG